MNCINCSEFVGNCTCPDECALCLKPLAPNAMQYQCRKCDKPICEECTRFTLETEFCFECFLKNKYEWAQWYERIGISVTVASHFKDHVKAEQGVAA